MLSLGKDWILGPQNMCGYQTLVPDYSQIRADLRAKWRILAYSRGFQFWKS